MTGQHNQFSDDEDDRDAPSSQRFANLSVSDEGQGIADPDQPAVTRSVEDGEDRPG